MVRDDVARDEGDDSATTSDPQPSQPPGSPRYHLIMSPKRRTQTNPQPTLTREAVDQLVREYPIAISAVQFKVRGVTKWYQEPKIILVNVIPPDHVDDLPIVEPNQLDDVPVIPEPVLVDEDEDPEEEEFKEEEEPQKEDDMEVDIEEYENELELTYPYEEVDPFNPPPPTSESEPEDVVEIEDMVKPEDENVPASVYEMTSFFKMTVWSRDGACIGLKEGKSKGRYYGNLIFDLGNEVRSSMEKEMAAMENLVRKLGNAEEEAESKKLKKELEEAKEFVFEERPNEVIDVSVEDEKSPSPEPRGSPRNS
ncbi:hypothetical protein Tco_1155663 [Tanacetum coccineum]